MSFFERYFARSTARAAVVARARRRRRRVLDPVGAAADRASRQLLGGRDELRAFIDAGDMSGWAHHVALGGRDGDVEFALGETRWTTAASASAPSSPSRSSTPTDGWSRYMVARSPAIAFEPARVDAADFADGLIAGTPDAPR
jgi:hypothetical protein